MTTAFTTTTTLEPPAPESAGLSAAALLESLLFVASGPVSEARLAVALELTPVSYTHLDVYKRQVQYSPDFTQAHEFGLTLKWGLEVEAIRKT